MDCHIADKKFSSFFDKGPPNAKIGHNFFETEVQYQTLKASQINTLPNVVTMLPLSKNVMIKSGPKKPKNYVKIGIF
jgi:hypothetical protein